MSSAQKSQIEGSLLSKATFAAHPDVLKDIRRFVEHWGRVVGLAPAKARDLVLAVNEACSNAMEHPREEGDLTLLAWRELDRFTIDVYHPGEFRAKGEWEEGHRGLGLPLMVRMADRVLFSTLPGGGTRISLSVFLPGPGG
jgi:anti-sigma regulatory factor (Ser/Thr protein kinase)